MNHILADYKEIFEILEKYLTHSQEEKIYIWLSWGRSFDEFYEDFHDFLKKLPKNIVQKLFFWFVDERIVPLKSPERNFTQIFDKFYKDLLKENIISNDQILTIDEEETNLIWEENKKIKKFHIAFFWSGEDGHIASLFPHHPLLEEKRDGFLEIFESPKFPPHRITISPKMIEAIDLSFVFFIGTSKENAYKKFLDPQVKFQEIPAKLIIHSKSYYVFQK